MDHDDATTHSKALTTSRRSKCREPVRRTRSSRKLHQCPHCSYSIPNTLEICDVTSVFTLERSHTHVRSVVNASHILQVVLFTCAQFILLDKLNYTSALTVLTLPNMVQALCGDTYVLTPERSHTHVRSVVNASRILQIVLLTCA